MPNGQTGQQILGFHADGLVRLHRKDQVNRFAFYLLKHELGVVKVQPKQSDHAGHGRFINIFSVPEHVPDFGAIGIEPDVPDEIDVIQFLQRLDGDIYPNQVVDPALHRLRERLESFTTRSQIERHVELIAALPIVARIVCINDIDIGLGGNAEHRHKRSHRGRIQTADRLFVGGNQRAIVESDALGAEKQLGGAQHTRILDAIERIAQNHMYKLIDEERRNVAHSFAHKSAKSSLKCLVPQQMIAEVDQQLPIFARIRIGDDLYVR